MSNTNEAMTPEQFRVLLGEVLALAELQDAYIEKSKIDEFFKDYTFTDEQMQMVYDFLLSKKIQVGGYSKTDGDASGKKRELTVEEKRFAEQYKEDLAEIAPATEAEWQELLTVLAAGKEDETSSRAKRRLTELMLPDIFEMAQHMIDETTLLSDLTQEGSLKVFLMVDTFTFEGKSAQDVRLGLLAGVREAMEALREEQKDTKSRDRNMVEKVQNLKDGIEVLKDEYGRKVYLDEAADFMNITEEEAEKILRLAGDEVPPETEV